MRKINMIVYHCSATHPRTDIPAETQWAQIRQWHLDKGWRDIGYHYGIGRKGERLFGRPVEQVGAHVKGRNSNSIGICLLGGFGAGADDGFNMHFTPEQGDELAVLTRELLNRFGPNVQIHGHNEFANKGCPGFHAPTWWKANMNRLPKGPRVPDIPDVFDPTGLPTSSSQSGGLWGLIAGLVQVLTRIFSGRKEKR